MNEVVELDSALGWLKKVSGIDDAYIAQWPERAWVQWAKAMHGKRGEENPAVPDWMQPHLGSWHYDFSLPFPQVGQLWPTAHDWFAETENHPEFTLSIDEPDEEEQRFTLTQLRTAWHLARTQGATPMMNMLLLPQSPWGEVIEGTIEAFYVIGSDLSNALQDQLDQLMGTKGRPNSVTGTAEELALHAGLTVSSPPQLRAWEWMYG